MTLPKLKKLASMIVSKSKNFILKDMIITSRLKVKYSFHYLLYNNILNIKKIMKIIIFFVIKLF